MIHVDTQNITRQLQPSWCNMSSVFHLSSGWLSQIFVVKKHNIYKIMTFWKKQATFCFEIVTFVDLCIFAVKITVCCEIATFANLWLFEVKSLLFILSWLLNCLLAALLSSVIPVFFLCQYWIEQAVTLVPLENFFSNVLVISIWLSLCSLSARRNKVKGQIWPAGLSLCFNLTYVNL